jgi:hypothetical protein
VDRGVVEQVVQDAAQPVGPPGDRHRCAGSAPPRRRPGGGGAAASTAAIDELGQVDPFELRRRDQLALGQHPQHRQQAHRAPVLGHQVGEDLVALGRVDALVPLQHLEVRADPGQRLCAARAPRRPANERAACRRLVGERDLAVVAVQRRVDDGPRPRRSPGRPTRRHPDPDPPPTRRPAETDASRCCSRRSGRVAARPTSQPASPAIGIASRRTTPTRSAAGPAAAAARRAARTPRAGRAGRRRRAR